MDEGRSEACGDQRPAAGSCRDQGELLAVLDRLSLRVQNVAAWKPGFEDLSRLGSYVAEIRRLLFELSRLQAGRQGKRPAPADCRILAERYLELEGMVKELRNDRRAS